MDSDPTRTALILERNRIDEYILKKVIEISKYWEKSISFESISALCEYILTHPEVSSGIFINEGPFEENLISLMKDLRAMPTCLTKNYIVIGLSYQYLESPIIERLLDDKLIYQIEKPIQLSKLIELETFINKRSIAMTNCNDVEGMASK